MPSVPICSAAPGAKPSSTPLRRSPRCWGRAQVLLLKGCGRRSWPPSTRRRRAGMVHELRREARPRSRWVRLGPALVAAAAAVVAVLAYSVVNLHGQVSNDNQALSSVSLQAPIRAALADRHHVDVDLDQCHGFHHDQGGCRARGAGLRRLEHPARPWHRVGPTSCGPSRRAEPSRWACSDAKGRRPRFASSGEPRP